MKSTYIRCVRAVGKAGGKLGLFSVLERRRKHRTALWIRSLFSIYDIDDLVHLDLAWWTFDAMDIVDAFMRDKPGARVFEYGAGASTLWLARRGAVITSVEHDPDWGTKMVERTRGDTNIQIRIVAPVKSDAPRYRSAVASWSGHDFEGYVHSIDEQDGAFDLIVIDGRCRAACLERAKGRLAEGGLILFDNSRRSRYRESIRASGMDPTVTRGLVPGLPYPDETTLLVSCKEA